LDILIDLRRSQRYRTFVARDFRNVERAPVPVWLLVFVGRKPPVLTVGVYFSGKILGAVAGIVGPVTLAPIAVELLASGSSTSLEVPEDSEAFF
jgi:hypothetical protein